MVMRPRVVDCSGTDGRSCIAHRQHGRQLSALGWHHLPENAAAEHSTYLENTVGEVCTRLGL